MADSAGTGTPKEHKVDLFRAFQQQQQRKKKKERKAFQWELRLFRVPNQTEGCTCAKIWVCGFGQFNTQHRKYLHTRTWQNFCVGRKESRALGKIEHSHLSSARTRKMSHLISLFFASAFWARRPKQPVQVLGSVSGIHPHHQTNERLSESQSQTVWQESFAPLHCVHLYRKIHPPSRSRRRHRVSIRCTTLNLSSELQKGKKNTNNNTAMYISNRAYRSTT